MPEVKAAKQQAAEHFVDMWELQRAVGKRLAELSGAESGMITAGAGLNTAVIGIGEVGKNNDPQRDQFVANLAGCQTARDLTPRERRDIISRVAGLHGIHTNFYQRPGSGLQPPQNVRLNRSENGPVEVLWDTAYAAASPLATYEIFRRHDLVARVPCEPQISEEPFRFVDNGVKGGSPGGLWYRVRVVDAEGAKADSNTVLPPQAMRLSG